MANTLPRNYDNMSIEEKQSILEAIVRGGGDYKTSRAYGQYTTPVDSGDFSGYRMPSEFVDSGKVNIAELVRYLKDPEAFSSVTRTIMSPKHTWGDVGSSIGSSAIHSLQVPSSESQIGANEILTAVMDTLTIPENAHSQIDSLIQASSQDNFPILDTIRSLFEINKSK